MSEPMRKNYRQREQQQQQQQQFSGNVMGYHAACSFNADAAAAAFFRQRGFSSFVRNGAGDYSLTMTSALDLAGGDGVVSAGVNSNAAAAIGVEVVSATVLRVRTISITVGADADTAAADIDFWLMVTPLGPN